VLPNNRRAGGGTYDARNDRWTSCYSDTWGGSTLGSPLWGPSTPSRPQLLKSSCCRSSRTRTSTVGAPSQWRPATNASAREQRAAGTGEHENPVRKVVSRPIQYAPRPSGWEPLAANPLTTPSARVSHPASPNTTFPPDGQSDPPHPPDGVPVRVPPPDANVRSCTCMSPCRTGTRWRRQRRPSSWKAAAVARYGSGGCVCLAGGQRRLCFGGVWQAVGGG